MPKHYYASNRFKDFALVVLLYRLST